MCLTRNAARAIVLAHGLCGTADSGLYEMADGFAQNGFHALVFDYRNFGKSGGKNASTYLFRCNVKTGRRHWIV